MFIIVIYLGGSGQLKKKIKCAEKGGKLMVMTDFSHLYLGHGKILILLLWGIIIICDNLQDMDVTIFNLYPQLLQCDFANLLTKRLIFPPLALELHCNLPEIVEKLPSGQLHHVSPGPKP